MTKQAEPSIGVVLTCYKRPHLLQQQLDALRAQTVPFKELVVWCNGVPVPDVDFKPNESFVLSSINRGVWPRFAFAQCLDATHICVLDDDTIPGNRWFENCLNCTRALPPYSLLGTCGVAFPDGTRASAERYGWCRPSDKLTAVDLIGHAWFAERKLFSQFSVRHEFGPTCGEDYCLSWLARSNGGIVACPPHPPNDKSLWGSLEGMELGSDDVALWVQPGEPDKKQRVHDELRRRGWKTVNEVYR